MSSKNWFKEDRTWLEKEKKIIKENYPNFRLIENNELLYWEGDVVYEGEKYKLRIEYPFNYPYMRPDIFVLSETGEVLMDFETSHQYKDGRLCLFTNDGSPNDWKIEYTVKDVIDRFKNFLEDRTKPEFEDKHTSYFSRYYGQKDTEIIVIIPNEFRDFIIRNKYGMCNIAKLANLDGFFYIITQLESTENKENITIEQTDLWKSVRRGPDIIRGAWCFIGKPSPSFNNIKTNKSLCKMIKRKIKSLPSFDNHFPMLIVYKKGKIYSSVGYWMDLNRNDFYKKLPIYFDCEFKDLRQDIFKRTKNVIGAGLTILRNKTVICIGLGSIGSTIALELAKSGIERFILYDPDIIELSNLSKHICNIEDIGRFKVNAVKDLLKKRNPGVDVKCHANSPLNQGEIKNFINYLKNNEDTLIITSIAEHEEESIINELAVKNAVTVIYVTALGKAEYGRIFRVIPKKTACYECIGVWNSEEPDKYPSFKIKEEKDSLGEFAAYRHPGFPGVSIDVGFIGLFAARFALQTLLRNTEAKSLYPDVDVHHFIWSNRSGWIFNESLRVKEIDYPINSRCPVCQQNAI